jgi:hypothetical protein
MISSLAVNTQQWRTGRIAVRAIYSNVCTDSSSVEIHAEIHAEH